MFFRSALSNEPFTVGCATVYRKFKAKASRFSAGRMSTRLGTETPPDPTVTTAVLAGPGSPVDSNGQVSHVFAQHMGLISEELQFLLRSETRLNVLSALAQREPLGKDTLDETLDTSRRTLTRTLTQLESRRLIEGTDDGYRLTAFGETQAASFREWLRRDEIAQRLQPVLGHLEAGLFEFDIEHLRGATLTVADESQPYAVLDRTLTLREHATRIRELAPSVERRSVKQLAERIESGERLDVETVMTAGTARTAQSEPAYEDAVETITAAEGVSQHVYPGQFPLFLGIMDETVVVGAAADGEPHAMLETTDDAVREWARETFDSYRTDARPIGIEPSTSI